MNQTVIRSCVVRLVDVRVLSASSGPYPRSVYRPACPPRRSETSSCSCLSCSQPWAFVEMLCRIQTRRKHRQRVRLSRNRRQPTLDPRALEEQRSKRETRQRNNSVRLYKCGQAPSVAQPVSWRDELKRDDFASDLLW